MKSMTKTTLTISPIDDRYCYSRQSTLTVSEEHFTPKEIAKLQTTFIMAATRSKAGIETSTTEIEIPGDIEESWKIKAEKAQKAQQEAEKDRTKAEREKQAMQVYVAAQRRYVEEGGSLPMYCCIEEQLPIIVTSSWNREEVKKAMVELKLTID
jgi:hypothetical protein